MAAYIDIRLLFNDSDLVNKVAVATVIYAHGLIAGTPDAADKGWIAAVFSNPQAEAKKILMGVLAANESMTVAQIQAASDSAIQTQVDLIAPILIDALAGV